MHRGQHQWHSPPILQPSSWHHQEHVLREYLPSNPLLNPFLLPFTLPHLPQHALQQHNNWGTQLLSLQAQFPLVPITNDSNFNCLDLRYSKYFPENNLSPQIPQRLQPEATPVAVDNHYKQLSPSSEDYPQIFHLPKKRCKKQHSGGQQSLPICSGSASVSPAGSAASVDLTSPVNGIRITSEAEFFAGSDVMGVKSDPHNQQHCRIVREDIGADQVEVTSEARAEIALIDNQLGEYVCRLCLIVYEDAFELARHRCPRIVHVEYCCPECRKTFNCPANLASHRRWHRPSKSLNPFSMDAILGWKSSLIKGAGGKGKCSTRKTEKNKIK